MSDNTRPIVAGLIVVAVRSILLWVVIPFGSAVWLVMFPWLQARRVTIGQFFGWLDLNLIAALQRTFRLVGGQVNRWIPARAMSKVTHRINAMDPF